MTLKVLEVKTVSTSWRNDLPAFFKSRNRRIAISHKGLLMRGKPVHGDRILGLRKAQGLTQEQLAEQAGLDVKTVRKAEQGKRLDLGTITKLCFVLQTELRHLIRPTRSARELEIRRRDVVIGWQRAFDDRDLGVIVRCYHSDAVLHLPGSPQIPFGGTFRGHKEIRRATQIFWKNCPIELLDEKDYSILVSDDTTIVQGHMGVQMLDDGLSLLHYTQILKFAGELIVDHRVEFDTLNFARLLRISVADCTA
jgi:transcriptional regulator with XRE-family HTH domain